MKEKRKPKKKKHLRITCVWCGRKFAANESANLSAYEVADEHMRRCRSASSNR